MKYYPPNRDKALEILAPGKRYLWKEEDWCGLTWLDDFPDNDQPTEAQVSDLIKSFDDSDLFDLKYAEIKTAFNEHLLNGCEISLGFKIDSTISDLTLLSIAHSKGKLKDNSAIKISDFDNNIQTLILSDFEIMLIEFGDFIDSALDKKWLLRERIYNAENGEELNLIKW